MMTLQELEKLNKIYKVAHGLQPSFKCRREMFWFWFFSPTTELNEFSENKKTENNPTGYFRLSKIYLSSCCTFHCFVLQLCLYSETTTMVHSLMKQSRPGSRFFSSLFLSHSLLGCCCAV